jgi:hypothetical protein
LFFQLLLHFQPETIDHSLSLSQPRPKISPAVQPFFPPPRPDLAKNQSRQRPLGLPTGYLKQRSGKKRKKNIQISRERSRTKNEKERKPKLVASSFLLQVFIGDTAGTGKEERRRSIRSPLFFTLPATVRNSSTVPSPF